MLEQEIVKKAIEETVAKFGKLAGVVNCGGVATAARVSKYERAFGVLLSY
jgi:3-hydroxyacyl-CoA dehydrogenase / 3-hydroxy-2-methylbutyryl-CoA dehydrogenase